MGAKLRQEEILRIFELQELLDHCEVLIQCARHYLALGWHLAVVSTASGPMTDIDFHGPEARWSRQLQDLALEVGSLALGVHTGRASRLLVLELPMEAVDFPDYLSEAGSSTCMAEAAPGRRLCFYSLPDDWHPPASFLILSYDIMVHGEGGLVTLPPSLDPKTQVPSRWLRPPWDIPPAPLAPEMKDYLRLISPGHKTTTHAAGPKIPLWRTIYPAIAPHPEICAALFAPAPSSPAYYRQLLTAALTAGLRDPHILFGLLWYAPLGRARQHPQGGQFLQDLVKFTVSSLENQAPEEAHPEPEPLQWASRPPCFLRTRTA